MDKCIETTTKLLLTTSVTYSPIFETAIGKVQSGNEVTMTQEEKDVLVPIKISQQKEEG